MSSKAQHIALLAGGRSHERQVSLEGAQAVAAALKTKGYVVHRYDPASDLARLAEEAGGLDAAFILLHGLYGEDGTVQGFLDLLGLPYQGSGVLGSALAMDKGLAKEIYRDNGLPVAPWHTVRADTFKGPAAVLDSVSLPLVIKPLRQGSSIGMGLAHTPEELEAALETAFAHDKEVMCEEFVAGREITVGVLGNDELTPLPLVEIIPGEKHPFFNYEAKYQAGASEEICPADLPEEIRRKAQDYAIRAHQALRLMGYSRTDMLVRPDGSLVLLETNTIPGMTPTSLLPQAAKAHGLDFAELVDHLLKLALAGPKG